jgi:outer membrane lipoprotein SlyB
MVSWSDARIGLCTTLMLLLVQAAGCANTSTPSGAPPVRDEPEVYYGTVEGVRRVPLPGSSGAIGAMGGATAGGIAGGHVGAGRGSQAASVAGAVAGSVAGYALEGAVTEKEGLEISVRLDSGQLHLILQPDGESFKPGDRVRVIAGEKGARVTH